MTSLTPRPPRRRPSGRRAYHWVSLVFFTAFGLGLASSPAWSDRELSAMATIGWVLLGLAVLTVPLMTWTRFLAPPRPERSVVTRGDALEIRVRTGGPAATAVLGAVWSALAVWAVMAGGATSGGLFALPLVLLFAGLIPDCLRAATRRPFLRLDANGVRLRGWSLDGEIDWSDVISVDILVVRPRRPVIRLVARTGAASLSRSWHRYLVHLDLRTDEPVLDVPLLALDAPGRVAALLNLLGGLPRDERERQLTGTGPAFLRGDVELDL